MRLLASTQEVPVWPLLASMMLGAAAADDGVESWRALDYRLAADRFAMADQRYRRGRSLHRAGNVAMATGFVLLGVGAGVTLGECGIISGGPCNSPVAVLGGTTMLTGLAMYAGGPLLSNLGALHAAGALRRRGADVAREAGIVGVALAGASIVIPTVALTILSTQVELDNLAALGAVASFSMIYVPVASLIAARVQMVGPNRKAIPGILDLTVVPTRTQHGAGLAMSVRF